MTIILRRYHVDRLTEREDFVDATIPGVMKYFIKSGDPEFEKHLPDFCRDPNGEYYVIIFSDGFTQVLARYQFEIFRKHEKNEEI